MAEVSDNRDKHYLDLYFYPGLPDGGTMNTPLQKHDGSVMSYTTGFVLSIALTVVAYLIVVNHSLSGDALIVTIVGLAFIQLFVQLFFFLHLDKISARGKMYVFLFMILVVSILVFGSLWIMKNLNYQMTPADTAKYLQNQDGF